MTKRIRKQFHIDPDQASLLKYLSQERRLTEAEIIRRALAKYLEDNSPSSLAWSKEKQFIGELIAQGPIEGGRTWKREDLYDR
jgi:hypothetical protein